MKRLLVSLVLVVTACGGDDTSIDLIEGPLGDKTPRCVDVYDGQHLVQPGEQDACIQADGTTLITGTISWTCVDGGSLSWGDAGYVLNGIGYPHAGDAKVPPDSVRDACSPLPTTTP